MSDADSRIAFDELLKRVLAHWPESVDVGKLLVYGGRDDLYVVAGLGPLGDEVAEYFAREQDAILLVLLCDSIAWALRSAAAFNVVVKLSTLRSEVVREDFEKRLLRATENADLGWKSKDLALVRRYFSVNA